MNKVLSIVIPVFNKFSFTKSALNDLFHLPDDHEIIIIDNGSSDETESELKDNKEISYYRNSNNQGFSAACNIGYGMASAPNVLFLNNDIRVKSNKDNWTKLLIDKCVNALVGPTMGKLDDNFNFIKESNEYLDGNSYLSGWCIASSKDIWNKLKIKQPFGIMTDCYVPHIWDNQFFYFSDPDLCWRAKQLGIKMEVVDIPVVHFGKISSAQLNVGKLYNEGRNLFINKWGSDANR
jgi:GT2 family glycosyltransferase